MYIDVVLIVYFVESKQEQIFSLSNPFISALVIEVDLECQGGGLCFVFKRS